MLFSVFFYLLSLCTCAFTGPCMRDVCVCVCVFVHCLQSVLTVALFV